MKLPFFGARFLSRLKRDIDHNVGKYGVSSAWLEDFASGEKIVSESRTIVGPPPKLMIEDGGAHYDGENARRVYSWLEGLTPAVAMEERLWSCLSHWVFPEYMSTRWPATDEGVIRRRYFLEGSSFAALTRNGISRLWWAAFLTKDDARDDPFDLTETLFLRQDIEVSLLERSLGKCRSVRFGVLEFIKRNRDWLSEGSFGKHVQVLLRELNLLGGVAILDALPSATIAAYLERVGKRLQRDAAA